jgi:hypothetical protein
MHRLAALCLHLSKNDVCVPMAIPTAMTPSFFLTVAPTKDQYLDLGQLAPS